MQGQAQTEKKEKTGLFSSLGVRVKPGLTASYFYNFTGEYVYILQQNASVKEKEENKDGATLTFVVHFSLDKQDRFTFLLNLPFLDYKGNLTGSSDNFSLFNSQTPFGVGLGWFPFPKTEFLGFTAMLNVGTQKRMRKDAIDVQFFPIADYPKMDLQVGAPVPYAVLDKFMYKETVLALNIGVSIRF
jgi:hypothetical protein